MQGNKERANLLLDVFINGTNDVRWGIISKIDMVELCMKAAPVLLLQQSVEVSERCRKLGREHSRTGRTL